MMRIHVKCSQGIGDNIYVRPIVQRCIDEGNEVYLTSVVPQLFSDLNVKLVFPPTTFIYRTQLKALADTQLQFHQLGEVDKEIDLFYTAREIGRNNIVGALENKFGYVPGSTKYQLSFPDLTQVETSYPLVLPPGKIAVIRPVTHRKEWLCTSRSPNPNYVGWCAKILKSAGYYVISIADTIEGEEWIEEEPLVDLKLHKGELGLLGTFRLLQQADIVIGGSGMIVPAAIAAQRPYFFLIFGGRGGFDNPQKLFDLRMNMKKIDWVIPDRFCRCLQMDHACSKDISNMDDKFFRFMKGVE